jgi:GNAT superfamily N-acetyltransferase
VDAGADLEPSVALLADHAGFIDCLVRWYEQEWQPYYGERGPGDARADLQSRCNRGRLPIGFVAIQDDRILGTAALDHDATTGRTPSVVGLLVGPDHRRRGVANEMIGFAERLARDLGYDELFMSTGILGELVRRRGWQELGDVQFLHDERGKVYMCPLTLSRSP